MSEPTEGPALDSWLWFQNANGSYTRVTIAHTDAAIDAAVAAAVEKERARCLAIVDKVEHSAVVAQGSLHTCDAIAAAIESGDTDE